jgi:hypothetical protein
MISVKLDSLLKKEGVTNLQLIEENIFFRLAKKQLLERLYQRAEARDLLQWSLIMHFAVLIGAGEA